MDERNFGENSGQQELSESQIQNQNLNVNALSEGPWTLDQNKKYSFFVTYFKTIFVSKQRRKSIRIFKSLADYLVTRNPRQCRSHYQKLMLKFKTINKFRKHYRNQVGPEIYDQEYQQFSYVMDAEEKQRRKKRKQEENEGKQFASIGVQTEGIFPLSMMNANWPTTHNLPDQSNFVMGLWPFLPGDHSNQEQK